MRIQSNGSRLMGSIVQLCLPCINYVCFGGPFYMNALWMLVRQGEEVHACSRGAWESLGDKNVSGGSIVSCQLNYLPVLHPGR